MIQIGASYKERTGSSTTPNSVREPPWGGDETHLWLDTRDGLAGRLVDLSSGQNRWASDRILGLAEELLPAARTLDCEQELLCVARIVCKGGGADHQRRLVETAGTVGLHWEVARETQREPVVVGESSASARS